MITSVLSTRLDSALQLISFLFLFALVLALCYFTTRWIANYQRVVNKNKNLRVIETLRLANNKYLQIVEVGTEYFVIGIGKDEIHNLGKISAEQLNEIPKRQEEQACKNVTESFQDILKKIKNQSQKK